MIEYVQFSLLGYSLQHENPVFRVTKKSKFGYESPSTRSRKRLVLVILSDLEILPPPSVVFNVGHAGS